MRAKSSALVATVALCAILAGCSAEPLAKEAVLSQGDSSAPKTGTSAPTRAPAQLPSYAEGIAYIDAGRVWTVRAGVARPITTSTADRRSLSVSTDGRCIVWIETAGGRATVRATVRAVDMAGGTARELLSQPGPSLLESVRYEALSHRLWYSVVGGPEARLETIADGEASSPCNVDLAEQFSGEFDVADHGRLIAYTSAIQNPARVVVLRDGRALQWSHPMLACAFTPTFSRDTTKLCFTGAERPGGPIAVWVSDVATGRARMIASTAGLAPRTPVFSPDGRHVAFASGVTGDVYVVAVDGGVPKPLGIRSEEAQIAW